MKAVPFIVLGITMILSAGCGNRPAGVLSDSKMSSLLADIHLAEAYSNRLGSEIINDSSRKVLRQSVLADNGVDEKEFQASLDWYGHHIDDYTKLYDEVERKLQKKAGSAGESKNSNIDNLWPLAGMMTIMPKDYTNGFSFSIESSGIEPGAAMIWKMRFNRMNSYATVLLAAEYGAINGQYVYKQVNQPGTVELLLDIDSIRSPKRIYGYVHLDSKPIETVWVDSIYLYKADKRPVNTEMLLHHFKIPDKKKTLQTMTESDSLSRRRTSGIVKRRMR